MRPKRVLILKKKRPNTADSVMSRNDVSRAHSRNTCLLPRFYF